MLARCVLSSMENIELKMKHFPANVSLLFCGATRTYTPAATSGESMLIRKRGSTTSVLRDQCSAQHSSSASYVLLNGPCFSHIVECRGVLGWAMHTLHPFRQGKVWHADGVIDCENDWNVSHRSKAKSTLPAGSVSLPAPAIIRRPTFQVIQSDQIALAFQSDRQSSMTFVQSRLRYYDRNTSVLMQEVSRCTGFGAYQSFFWALWVIKSRRTAWRRHLWMYSIVLP